MKTTTGNKNAPQYSSVPIGNASLLIDKINARRSTPDSEVLASSDDEVDLHRQELQLPTTAPSQKPTRRASWLNDTTQPQPRKGSFASSSMSPTASNPSTPAAEIGAWNAHTTSSGIGIGRAASSSNSFPWATGIWNSDGRKEPPSRLTEVLPDSSSLLAFNTNSNPSFSTFQHRDNGQETTIPFAIPLHPTPKTYRSQSYSVGQLDPDSSGILLNNATNAGFNSRGKNIGNSSGLQHRPSRPSMLSEMTNDGVGLDKVKEVDDDDDESPTRSLQGTRVQMEQARAIEELARENAILRQQNINSSRLRSRSSTSGSALGSHSQTHLYPFRESLPEESDYAVDELDEVSELQELTNRGLLNRRLSEYGLSQPPKPSPYTALENRKLESVKKAYWQSSLGFGGPAEMPQSRRHSFADVPTRHGSVGAFGESNRDTHSQEIISPQDNTSPYLESTKFLMSEANSYFGGPVNASRVPDPHIPGYPMSTYQAYSINPRYVQARSSPPPPPSRNVHGMPQARHNQLLYIVLFKCSRADVFYVQEGTGLSVKPGDLVIVEADRGTDLGTVAQDNVDWAQAKELKEHYAEEHYKWLMMYSQGAAGSSDGTGAGLMAASNGLQGSAVGGMGPPNQHGMPEPTSGELKPKVIKRLAQPHEIQSLRDKEGNEAKAKRVCMQKVKEHGLHMEILDAEFQMDWKKLTFYYFADAYINFNSLVTDLFKVYKTRIWMSAINPASFASPSLGLQVPSGIGPGAVGITRPVQVERRFQQQEQLSYSSSAQEGRIYQSAGSPYHTLTDRGQLSPTSLQYAGYPYGYSPFAPTSRSSATSLENNVPNTTQSLDPLTTFPTTSDYQRIAPRFSSSLSIGSANDNGSYGRQGEGDGISAANSTWVTAMQTLSLNGL